MAATEIVGDSVAVSIGEVTLDLVGENNLFLQADQHTVEKFVSQQIKENAVTVDGTYGSTSITCTFDESAASTIIGYWETGELVDYTTPYKSYEDCLVRVSGGPTVTPGKKGYVTMTVEITSTKIAPGPGTGGGGTETN